MMRPATTRSRLVSRCLWAVLAFAPAASAAAENAAGEPGAKTAKSEDLLAGDGLLESFSLSSDRGPVRIESATLEFEYRTGELTYRGGVVVNQADITLNCDSLVVKLDVENVGRPTEIVAAGNVRIVNGERVATGGRAVFDQAAQTITLSEAAVLRDGPNEVAGARVVVFLDEQRSVVEGGQERVRAVLFPNSKSAQVDPADVSKAPANGG